MKQWYIYRNGIKVGPLNFSEVKNELGSENEKVKILDPSTNQWLSYLKFSELYLKDDLSAMNDQSHIRSESTSSKKTNASVEDESNTSSSAFSGRQKVSKANLEPTEKDPEPKLVDKNAGIPSANPTTESEKNSENLDKNTPTTEKLAKTIEEPSSNRAYKEADAQTESRRPEPEVAHSEVPDNYKTGVNVWRRYLASTFDITLLSLFIGLVLGFTFPEVLININKYVLSFLILVVSIFIEPIFLSQFGHTPGKYLLSLKVLSREGKIHSYETAANRTIHKFIYGYGLGIPIISLFTMISSANNYKREGISKWDEGVNGQIYGYGLNTGKIIAFILIYITYIFIIGLSQVL